VVFAWDTRASVDAYLPVIYNAMSTYAEGLVLGHDAANLMPFGSGLLLGEWYGEPYLIQKVLNEYPREESSSTGYTHGLTRIRTWPAQRVPHQSRDSAGPSRCGGRWNRGGSSHAAVWRMPP
jgi:hypothetical protein